MKAESTVWVKICGITRLANALEVADQQPDAIGLNFFAASKRRVEVATARQIVQKLPPGVEPIGVFVNHSVADIREIATICGLRTVQLHGDELPDFAEQLQGLRILKAFRADASNLDSISAEMLKFTSAALDNLGTLVDAKVAGTYGGTGVAAPWELLAQRWTPAHGKLILAGGLNPENVASAVRTVKPWGVDVAGGVESSPGIKNITLVRKFIREARRAGLETKD